MKILTKLNVLLVSVLGLIVAGILYKMFPEQFANKGCWALRTQCFVFQVFFGLIIFVPILLFSIITYKMKEAVFKLWAWFSLVFAIVYIYITVTEKGPLDVFSIAVPVTALFFCIVYSILSIVIISIQLFRTRNSKESSKGIVD